MTHILIATWASPDWHLEVEQGITAGVKWQNISAGSSSNPGSLSVAQLTLLKVTPQQLLQA